MLTITKPAADRLDIVLSGSLDAEGMTSALDKLLAESEGITSGKMLYTISDFQMPTLGALSVEFQYMPKLFGLVGRFDRCAVVSDAGWIRTAAEIEGALIPGLEIKAFTMEARDAAEAWLESPGADAPAADENFPV